MGRRRHQFAFAGFARERLAQRQAAAIVSHREQIVVRETKQRTAQHGRERQIVLRQEQRVGERHQIHHRDVFGEDEAVGAGDFDVLVLQRADDRFEQFAALAHQNQNIAVAHGPALDADRLAAIDHALDRAGNAFRQFDARARLVDGVERRVPAFDFLALIGLRRLPHFDQAWRRVRQGDVRRKAIGIRGDARRDELVLENFVDGGEHARAGAERMLKLTKFELQLGALMRGCKVSPHLVEFLRRGILERIDRLLLVADRENRAGAEMNARARGEFRDQSPDDLPLLVAGVLRFVDQQMIDAEIELVMHPGRIDIGEERQRLVDQVVIIDEAAALFLAVIAR